MTKHYRQGDVLIKRIDAIPAEATKAKDCILAHGEVTGHTHRFDAGATQFLAESGARYVRVHDPMAALNHEEHGTLAIPAGDYEVKIQVEYTPQAIRNVLD